MMAAGNYYGITDNSLVEVDIVDSQVNMKGLTAAGELGTLLAPCLI